MSIKTYKQKFIDNIPNNHLWIPPLDVELDNIDDDYIIYESLPHNTTSVTTSNIRFDNTITDNKNIKVKKVFMHFTDFQKNVIQKWFKCYIKMYNVAIREIKKIHLYRKHKIAPAPLNWKNIRDLSQVKLKKKQIMSKASICDPYGDWIHTPIGAHEMDLAVKQAFENYKSACSNLKAENIKHFKLRYWKLTKQIKIMDFESTSITKKGIKHLILGQNVGTYNGKAFKFEEIDAECQLRYNDFEKSYILYVPIKYKEDKKVKDNDLIALDPGIRTFMSGITENKIVEIGGDYRPNQKIRVVHRSNGAKLIKNNREEKYADKIVKKLNMIDRYNSNILNVVPEPKRNKIINRCYNKIKNYVNELHWKSINYLTKNYNTVLVGNMSSKHICSNTYSNGLPSMVKRVATCLRFYVFRERLKEKCTARGVNYKCVNESYTSKICSICSNEKNDLGKATVYNCVSCKSILGRDINGARNIYCKAEL